MEIMETLDILTFGQWMRELREARGWTINQCAEKANVKWQAWQRLENDEPKRRDGSPSRPTRETVAKIAATLEAPQAHALQAAGYADSYWEGHNTVSAFDFVALYEGLGHADQDDLLQLALLKWKRKYPNLSPPRKSVTSVSMANQPGEFLCLNLRSGQLASASGIQPVENILNQQQPLVDILIRLLTWQDDPIANAQEIAQDIRQAQHLLSRPAEDSVPGVFGEADLLKQT